jgi:hypothetical protein
VDEAGTSDRSGFRRQPLSARQTNKAGPQSRLESSEMTTATPVSHGRIGELAAYFLRLGLRWPSDERDVLFLQLFNWLTFFISNMTRRL